MTASQSKLCFELTTLRKLRKTSAWRQVLHLSPKSFLCLQIHCSSAEGPGWILESLLLALYFTGHAAAAKCENTGKVAVRLAHGCALHSQNQFWASGVQQTFLLELEMLWNRATQVVIISKGDSWTNHVTVTSTRPSLRWGTEKKHGTTRKPECKADRALAACLLTFNFPSLFLSTQNNNNYHFIYILKKYSRGIFNHVMH